MRSITPGAMLSLAGALVLWLCHAALADAQVRITGEVERGSTGNPVRVFIENISRAEAAGIEIRAGPLPEGIRNLVITPPRVDRIARNDTARVLVTFDVAPDSPLGDRAPIVLEIAAQKGKLESRKVEIALKVSGAEQPGAGRGWRPLAYRLVLAEGKRTSLSSAAWAQRCTTDLSRGVTGGTVRCPDDEGVEHELSMRFTRYPQSFTLGQESIEFDAEILWRLGEYPPSHPCRARAPEMMHEHQRTVICPTGSLKNVHFPSCPDAYLCSTEGHGPGGEGRRVLKAELKPTRCETNVGTSCDSAEVEAALARRRQLGILGGTPTEYFYELWLDGKRIAEDARVIRIESFVKVDDKGAAFVELDNPEEAQKARRELADLNGPKAVKVHIAQQMGAVTLYYLPVLADDQRQAEVKPYQFPDAPETARVAGREAGARPTELSRVPSPRADDFGVPPEAFAEADSIVVASALNPLDPEVMQHMREWLAVAEPPENAAGAQLRYTTWGLVEGTVPGGRITANRPPDEAAGRTPAEYLWSKRDQLHSLRHCTLGTFVVARMNRSSIDRCATARPAASGTLVIDVEGMPALAAKQALERQRLDAALNLAEPAPARELASAVKLQRPVSGTRLKERERVALDVYGDYAPPVAIPKIIDQPGAVARRMLADLGLNATLRTIGTAPSATKAFRVFDVAPGEGTTLPPNSPVTISAYGPYEDRVKMPDVAGMDYHEAGRILTALGLSPRFESGGDVADPGKAYRIQRQDPPPGASVTPRQTVVLAHHGRYVFRGRMPNLEGMAQHAALARVEELPLRVVVRQGEPAPAARLSRTVAAQSIAPDRDITDGDSLTLTVFDTSIEEQLAAANCGALPGTVAAWDPAGRKAVCNCQPNLRPAADGVGCGAPRRPASLADPGRTGSTSAGTGMSDDFGRRQEEDRRRRQWEEQQRRRREAEEETWRREREWAERDGRDRACRRIYEDAMEAARRGFVGDSYALLRDAVGSGCNVGDADRIDRYIRDRMASSLLPPLPLLPQPPPPPRRDPWPPVGGGGGVGGTGYPPPPIHDPRDRPPPDTRGDGKVLPGWGDGMGLLRDPRQNPPNQDPLNGRPRREGACGAMTLPTAGCLVDQVLRR